MRKQKQNETNHYDKIIKENLRVVTPVLIDKVLNIKAIQSEDIPTKLQHTKEREADFLKIITDEKGDVFILHLEFQVADDPTMAFRMLDYNLMLMRIYDLPILQYVIYLGEKYPKASNQIKRPKLFFEYDVICVKDIPIDFFLNSKQPEEIIFSILANFGNENFEKVVENILESIKKTSNSTLQQEKCFQQLRIISNLRKFTPLIEKVMQSIATVFKEENDFLFIKGIKIGNEEGRQEGHQLGHEEGREVILKNGIPKLLQKGFSHEQIADTFSIPIEEVIRIIKKFNL
jgi:hypothetical protein